MNIKNVTESLTSRLVDALSALVSVADQNKVQRKLPTKQYDVVWFKDVEGRGEPQREHRTEPDLHGVDELVRQLVNENGVSSAIKALGDLAQSIIKGGSWPEGIPGPGAPDDLAESLITTYVRTVKSLSVDETIAAQTCEQFVNDICSTSYSAVSVYLVRNFNAPRAFQLDSNVQFRPISMQEFEEFGAVESGRIPSLDRPSLHSSYWICETLDTGPKSSQVYNWHYDSLEKVIGALNLTTVGQVGFRLLRNCFSSLFFQSYILSSRNYLYSGGTGGDVNLDEYGVEMFIQNYGLVKRVFEDSRFEIMRLPFRRLRSAASRGEDEDKLIDYVIGLERLLASDSETLEITFRFRLRGAAVLPTSFGDKRDRIKFMTKLYKLRSDIVHGRATVEDIREMLPDAEKSFIAIFRWFAQALDVAGPENVILQLDDALVSGASEWVAGIFHPTTGGETV